MTPLFSIIIPTFNRAHLLARCLDSLVAQTFKDFEVIVCDDGSTDNTAEIIEAFSHLLDLKYFWAPNWGGPARPRNIGIQHARADWICFLDSDDWWYSNKLEVASKNLSHDVIYHDLDVYNTNGKINTIRCRQLKEQAFMGLLSIQNALPNSSVITRKELLVKIGGISEDRNLIAIEDYDTWLRLALSTNRFLHLEQVLGAYWISGESNNISAGPQSIAREINLFKKYIVNIPANEQRQASQSRYFHIARNAHRSRFFKQAAACYLHALNGPINLFSIKTVLLLPLCLLHISR